MDARERFFTRRRLALQLERQNLVLSALLERAALLDHEIAIVQEARSRTADELEAAKAPKRKAKR